MVKLKKAKVVKSLTPKLGKERALSRRGKSLTEKRKEEKEFRKYLERVEDPNYQGGSWALPENATLLEKSKHELCKKMIVCKREKKLTTEKIAQKISLSLAETEDILHYRTDYFTLDRLMTYASKLFPTAEVEVFLRDKDKTKRTRPAYL